MKGKSLVSLLGLVLCLCVSSTLVMGDEEKAQLYAAWEVIVHPSKFMEYEEAYKQLVSIYTEYKFPYACYVYREDDFHYWLCMPINNYEALNDIFFNLERIEEVAGDNYQILTKRISSYCESVNTGTLKFRYDLSYVPKKPRVKYNDWNFFWECYYYVRPDMEKEAEKILKEWQTLYKSHDIPDILDIWAWCTECYKTHVLKIKV